MVRVGVCVCAPLSRFRYTKGPSGHYQPCTINRPYSLYMYAIGPKGHQAIPKTSPGQAARDLKFYVNYTCEVIALWYSLDST
jgi:hypothetical protein